VTHWIIWCWYTGRWWVGCYISYSEKRTGRGRSPSRPLLAVPNVTAHPSTASVPITVLLYNGSLFCCVNVTIKGLTKKKLKLDNTQRIHIYTSATKVFNAKRIWPLELCYLNQTQSWIRIQILALIRIRMFAESLPKCSGFVFLSTLFISSNFVKSGRWLYEKC